MVEISSRKCNWEALNKFFTNINIASIGGMNSVSILADENDEWIEIDPFTKMALAGEYHELSVVSYQQSAYSKGDSV